MITLLISVLLIIVAGAAKACHNIIDHKYSESIFSSMPDSWQWWLDPDLSWQNKYASPDIDQYMTEQDKETQKPAFWGSKGIFVWVTDLWHFAGMVENTSLIAGLLMLPVLFTAHLGWEAVWVFALDLALLKLCFNTSFSLFYNHIFKVKSPMKELNYRLYRLVAEAFTLSSTGASRFLAILYFFLILGVSLAIDMLLEATPVWQDPDRFRYSYLFLVIAVLAWIVWLWRIFMAGGKEALEERYQEQLRAKHFGS